MKIKNDLVRIQCAEKTYDFHNIIMQEYLKRFAIFQTSEENINKTALSKKLQNCLLKFDTPFENLTKYSEIHNQDFDVALLSDTNHIQELSDKQITIEYQYNNFDMYYDYNMGTAHEDPSIYYGRKITAIGFNSNPYNDSTFEVKFPVCSILDTSNYEIYFEPNQNLSITRKDIITTDADFNSKTSLIKGPAHLAPYGTPQIIDQPNIYQDNQHTLWQSFYDNGYGILYSIGFSNYKDYMDKELVIGTDIDLNIVNYGDTFELIIGDFNNNEVDNNFFPDYNLYPNSNLFPMQSNYKYVILKYKIWQIVHSGTYEEVISTKTDTGLYYYQIVPLDKFGRLNFRIKYERG